MPRQAGRQHAASQRDKFVSAGGKMLFFAVKNRAAAWRGRWESPPNHPIPNPAGLRIKSREHDHCLKYFSLSLRNMNRYEFTNQFTMPYSYIRNDSYFVKSTIFPQNIVPFYLQ